MANVNIQDVKIPFEETPGGDLVIVESRELASQRIVYGYTIEQGAIVHRPAWGAGLESFVNKPPNATNLQRIKNRAKNFLRTLPFLEEFSVEVIADGNSAVIQTDARTSEEELLVPEVMIG